jgi:hypothetical protein
MKEEGFKIFPDSAERATYRSGVTSSTIDFIFHRNATAQSQDIARIFIAQHKPVVSTFAALRPSVGENASNMGRALGVSRSLNNICHMPCNMPCAVLSIMHIP